MTKPKVKNQNAKEVKVINGINPRVLYEHQLEAMEKLSGINKKNSFHTLLVLPTGSGKTDTTANWLLKNCIDYKKKVIWITHRYLLVEQAAAAFMNNCYSDVMKNEPGFKYRLISGVHDKPIHIKSNDDILIVCKDSISKSLDILSKWVANQEVYVIIDEAHHATAKSYRKIIKTIEESASNVKLLGLTATPFRTSEKENGLLGKIFTDDIVYKVDLVTLIKKGILSRPIPESCETNINLVDSLGLRALRSIQELDIIPEEMSEKMAKNKTRNNIIVRRYIDNYEKYGQTLVFALNRTHAFALKVLFDKYGEAYGIKAGVVVSGNKSEFIGIDISNEENNKQIEAYKKGDIQVLINVNILTEGTDLPNTQTVFLTRPTISRVLMTQMIGRALRGEKAGGTAFAYIVSFVDDWNKKIAWVNPESIIRVEGQFPENNSNVEVHKYFRYIHAEKIAELARVLDDTVDTKVLDSVDFIRKIPLGMYAFSFIDEGNIEKNHQILVYDSTESAYGKLIKSLPTLFSKYGLEEEETIAWDILDEMCRECEMKYLNNDMIPPYNQKDVEYLLKFFAQKEVEPTFFSLDEIDRKKLDLSAIAHEVVKLNMRLKEQQEYINYLWDKEYELNKIFFTNKYFFKRILEKLIDKILNPYEYMGTNSNL